MYTVEFDIKVLTPLYMFGANQNNPELRTSEFKGMMRFWWRALKCCENIGELKEKEKEFFGGTSGEGCKSKVNVMVSHRNVYRNTGDDLKKDYDFDWNYNGGKKNFGRQK